MRRYTVVASTVPNTEFAAVEDNEQTAAWRLSQLHRDRQRWQSRHSDALAVQTAAGTKGTLHMHETSIHHTPSRGLCQLPWRALWFAYY